MDTVQTNVRVAEGDKPLILMVASRLRADPGFGAKLAALLEDQAAPLVEDRIKKLEQQVSWLLSGAIVVPRTTQRAAATVPTVLPKAGALARPAASATAGND